MTDDFIRYGTTGGMDAAYPDEIASIFVEYYMRQGGSKPIILLNSQKNRIEQQERALEFIKQYIDFFRQWAYRRADGDKELLHEIDNYINGLYEWLKQGKEKGQLDDIEHQRLKAQKKSLTDKLYDHIPERLISGGQTSIEQLLNDIQNYEYAIDYPLTPSFKWQNGEIERLGLISERIKLLMRLIKKIYSECAAKYHYLHYLGKIVGDISSYTGVLELSRDKYDWKIVDNNIEEYKRRFYRQHLPKLKELRQGLREADKTDQKRLQEIISALKRYKESGDKSALPPIRSLSDLLYKYKDQCTEKSVDVIIQLRRAVRHEAGYYSELLDNLSSDEFLEDLENVKSYVSAKTEQGEKKKRGRTKKYTVEQMERVRASFVKYSETHDTKGAWNLAAEKHNIESGKAAEMACRRYLNQNK